MHIRLRLLVVGALVSAACHSTPKPSTSPPSAPDSSSSPIDVVGFEQPESVLHDPAADVYLVSNVAGSPFEKDGRGYISRVSPEGEVLDREWISGLDAPKGMALSGELLVVSDITVVRRFNRTTGAVHDVIELPNATFLNDVTTAPDGSVVVSDSGFRAEGEGIAPTGTDALYAIADDGSVVTLASGSALSMPNGVVFVGDELVVATFGADKLLRFDSTGQTKGEQALGHAQLDGVVALDDGCVLVSSLGLGGVLRGRVGGTFAQALPVLAMDIGLDARRERLLLPRMMDGIVSLVPLPDGACD